MKNWLMALIFGLVVVLSACSGSSSSGELDGEVLFMSNCASCHTGNLSFTQGEVNLSIDEVEEIIRYGTGGMPPIKKLNEEEMLAIAHYLVDGK